jgi:hypothetical protein
MHVTIRWRYHFAPLTLGIRKDAQRGVVDESATFRTPAPVVSAIHTTWPLPSKPCVGTVPSALGTWRYFSTAIVYGDHVHDPRRARSTESSRLC